MRQIIKSLEGVNVFKTFSVIEKGTKICYIEYGGIILQSRVVGGFGVLLVETMELILQGIQKQKFIAPAFYFTVLRQESAQL